MAAWLRESGSRGPVMRVTGFSFEKSPSFAIRKIIGNRAAVCSSRGVSVPISLHMLRHERSAPIWLFSFVDLAFLLLIAFTQISSDEPVNDQPLAGIEVPHIPGPGTSLARSGSANLWQLRVGPPIANETSPPFRLIEPSQPSAEAEAIDATDLEARLDVLARRGARKPLLAPHPDARAEDLLVAADLLGRVFQKSRIVAVRPGPDVAAGTTGNATP